MITFTNDVTGKTTTMTEEELFECIISRHPAKRSIRTIQKELDLIYEAAQSSVEPDQSQLDRAKSLLEESLDLDEKYWEFVNVMRTIFFPVGIYSSILDDEDD